MTMSWMLYVLLVGSLLAVGALALDGLLRRTSLPTRWIWVATLAGIVSLASLAPRRDARPAWFNLSSAEISASGLLHPSTQMAGIGAILTMVRESMSSRVSRALLAADAGIPAMLRVPLVIGWCLLSALVLAVLVIVNRRVRIARREWPPAELHGIRVRIARSVGPAVIGFANPEIVVPRWLLERSADEQRLVVLHEGEHVAARDQLLLMGGWLVVALLPWHPAVWWALSRLRLAIELDCDARVLRRGVEPRPYGALLIDIAGQYAGVRVGALALADRTSHLERRLLAMKPSRTRPALVRAAALGAVAMLSIAIACEARLPTSAEVEAMNVASVEKSATQVKLLDGVSDQGRRYFLDDVAVTAAEAHAIAAFRIASVNVMKRRAEAGTDEIRIYTTKVADPGDSLKMRMPVQTALRGDSSKGAKRKAEHMMLKSKTAFTGLVLIDGVKSTDKALAAIAPADIQSVDILKGAAAANESDDPAAANGIIRVTTKKGGKAQ